MPNDSFTSAQITIMFKAQEKVLAHLKRSYDVTTDVQDKLVKIIMHISRKKLLTGLRFDAEEIAMDALFILMSLSSPNTQGSIRAH